MPEWGFTDSVAAFTGVDPSDGSAAALFNPFAAVPSMHVAFALMLAVPMARMARRAAGQGAVGGVPRGGHLRGRRHRQPLVVRRLHRRAHGGVAAVAAVGFARWRPAAWAWMPAPPASRARRALAAKH